MSAQGTPAPGSPAASPQPATRPRRILVVDDHKDAARVLGILLNSLGHEVQTANDGRQALDAVASFRPEIVFCDIGLPTIDGYEVARRVRQQPDLNGIKLIALTGWGQDQDKQRTREAGFDHHLVKPVAVKTLRDLLAAA